MGVLICAIHCSIVALIVFLAAVIARHKRAISVMDMHFTMTSAELVADGKAKAAKDVGNGDLVPISKHSLADVVETVRTLIGNDGNRWIFADLGCGEAHSLQAMLETSYANVFERLIGVEYDEGSCGRARTKFNASSPVDMVCGDMFKFVHDAYEGDGQVALWNVSESGALIRRRVVFYIGEPLWASFWSDEKVRSLYCPMLRDISRTQQEVYVVYIARPDVFMYPQQIAADCFEENGFVLRAAGLTDYSGSMKRAFPKYFATWRLSLGAPVPLAQRFDRYLFPLQVWQHKK